MAFGVRRNATGSRVTIAERVDRRARTAVSRGRVLPYLAFVTFLLSMSAGVAVWLIDRKDFHTLGDAMWWAIVTLATVGYGDIVPHSTWGRIVGSGVIVMGVTFIAVVTATVTSYFVSADREAAEEDS